MKNITHKILASISLLACLLLNSCAYSGRKYYSKEIAAEPITIQRFDLDFINADTTNTAAAVRALYEKYPEFMPVFMENILGIPAHDTAYITATIPHFLSDTMFVQVNEKVRETFSDIAVYEQSLGDAWARLQYFYPDAQQPDFYFFVSGFSQAFTMHQNILAVGSDMYLGADYEYYNRVVYEYMKYAMRPECIPADFISAYIFQNFNMNIDRVRLLDDMIYRGKLMYFLSVLFPETETSEIIGYTADQWDWCEKYEAEIWNTVLDKKDLFSTDYRTIASYMNDGPFTANVSNDSPGRLGTWIGMRIAEAYMENNPEVSMQEFLVNNDSQRILEMSKYRP